MIIPMGIIDCTRLHLFSVCTSDNSELVTFNIEVLL